MSQKINVSTRSLQFTIENQAGKTLLNGQAVNELDIQPVSPSQFHIIYRNKAWLADLISHNLQHKTFSIRIGNQVLELQAKNSMDLLLEKMGIKTGGEQKQNAVAAPMPGQILQINCTEGQQIQKGEKLLVLEAMKMENIIKSPADGLVKKIVVKEGQNVEKKQLLIEIG